MPRTRGAENVASPRATSALGNRAKTKLLSSLHNYSHYGVFGDGQALNGGKEGQASGKPARPMVNIPTCLPQRGMVSKEQLIPSRADASPNASCKAEPEGPS